MHPFWRLILFIKQFGKFLFGDIEFKFSSISYENSWYILQLERKMKIRPEMSEILDCKCIRIGSLIYLEESAFAYNNGLSTKRKIV